MSSLWVCLHLPRLPLMALVSRTAPRSAITVESSAAISPQTANAIAEGHPRTEIICVDRRAEAAGIHAGMSVASALSLLPSLQIKMRDLAAESTTLQWVAMAALRYSPTVTLAFGSTGHSVAMEVSTTSRLFGGVAALVALAMRDVRKFGLAVKPAAAPTPRGAWCLARQGERYHITTIDELARYLDGLPIEFLPSALPHLNHLHTLGLRTFADLRLKMQQSRAGLMQRTSAALIDEIDRCYGNAPDPLPLFTPPLQFRDALNLPVPIADVNMLQFAIGRLVRAMCHFLHARGLGVTQLAITFKHEDVPPTEIVIGVSITRAEKHLTRVLRERMQRVALVAPAESVALTCQESAPLAAAQSSLLPNSEDDMPIDDVMDRLRARIASTQLYALTLRADHRPERAFQQIAPIQFKPNARQIKRAKHSKKEKAKENRAQLSIKVSASRPIWLLVAPTVLTNHPEAAGYALLQGPERIESGWWDGKPIRRDYFIARNRHGQRCWLFRNADGAWYLHGLFA
jgi:protein ImuB